MAKTATADIFRNPLGFMERILDTLTNGILVTDENCIVRFINSAYARYLGAPKEDIVGSLVTTFIPDTRAPHVIATGKTEMGALRTFKGESGERTIIVNRFPFRDGKRVVGMLSLAVFGSREEYDAITGQIEALDKRIVQCTRRMRSALAPRYSLKSIIGRGQVMTAFRENLISYARMDLPVLLTGATGSGKELAANAIHCESDRRDGPFVGLNCASVPKDLLESELFGYAAGAFSGAHRNGKIGLIELADGGTLFLDEIGDAPAEVQAKLLRVLEEKTLYRLGSTQMRTCDFRLVSATNLDLRKLMTEGAFRQDLFYRISVLTLQTPSLHECREDIPLLVTTMMERLGKGNLTICERAMEALVAYSWPGNVRELRNVMSRAIGLCDGDRIELRDLPREVAAEGRRAGGDSGDGTLHASMAVSETQFLLETLQEEGGNVSRAARRLGISRTALYSKINKYGLRRDTDFRRGADG
ncbi:MAG: sigma 54-interacting transcriptional regulator [Desulfovibrio sp.]|jgi:transcriptional regulator with PAS, ATPase and Fis domain|nr:sigma 54-interacting transcriptional regulator [Desulfovibrio sp.]